MACPECGAAAHDGDMFCEGCGHELRVIRAGTVPVGSEGPCTRCGQPPGDDPEYCSGCGLRRRDGTDRVEIDLGVLAGVSDRGHVHVRNEDAMALGHHTRAASRVVLAAVVCDGVSSVRDPDVASRTAAETALTGLLDIGDRTAERCLRDAVASAAAAVAALSTLGIRDPPSCTLVATLVQRPPGEQPVITIGWVGDSRAYWLAESGARLLTADHSWAAERVAAGMSDMATAMKDRRAHAITRWIGADGVTEPDITTLSPTTAGSLLLCSDGLWNYLPDAAELAEITLPLVAEAGAMAAADALTAIALDAGGRDNITVVVIPVEAAPIEDAAAADAAAEDAAAEPTRSV